MNEVNEVTLQLLIRDSNAFFAAFSKGKEIKEFLTGKFSEGHQPYLNVVNLSDGSKICVKFVNTIKFLLDYKLKRRTDGESHLSYWEVMVYPAGMKAYSKTFDAKLIPIKVSKDEALAKNEAGLKRLYDIASGFGITLDTPAKWCIRYDESYKNN